MRIALTADWHLRQRQYGYAQRGDDFSAAARSAVEVINGIDCDHIIVAGDVFDHNRPSTQMITDMRDICAGFRKTPIVICGNHDYQNPSWMSIVHPLGVSYDQVAGNLDPVPCADGIVNMPVSLKRDDWMEAFRRAVATNPDVIIYHGSVLGVVPMYQVDNTPSLKDAADICEEMGRTRPLLLALGDIHVTGHNTCGCVTAVYPGSIEMCSKSESDIKHVADVTIDDKGINVNYHGIKTRRVLYVGDDIDMTIADMSDDVYSKAMIIGTVPNVDAADALRAAANPNQLVLVDIAGSTSKASVSVQSIDMANIIVDVAKSLQCDDKLVNIVSDIHNSGTEDIEQIISKAFQ